MISMDQQLFETPDTVMDSSLCGYFPESEPTCMMHHHRPKKMVAFEGSLTGRRFLGCPVQQEQNLGRVKDQQAHDKEVVQLKKEIDFLSNSYSQLVEDVSKLFDYQDGKMSHDMDYTSQAINKKKKELEDQARIEISMEKLKLAKEQRCILQSQADII
ncbi:hypothetical protein ZWY2020_005817 [Hordeum vulgare]|nr:hypothetical protein ZWY2020_005817 [Hordeum vulgare]